MTERTPEQIVADARTYTAEAWPIGTAWLSGVEHINALLALLEITQQERDEWKRIGSEAEQDLDDALATNIRLIEAAEQATAAQKAKVRTVCGYAATEASRERGV